MSVTVHLKKSNIWYSYDLQKLWILKGSVQNPKSGFIGRKRLFLSHFVLVSSVINRVSTWTIRRNRVRTKYVQEKRIFHAPSLAIYVICAPFCTYQRMWSKYSGWCGIHQLLIYTSVTSTVLAATKYQYFCIRVMIITPQPPPKCDGCSLSFSVRHRISCSNRGLAITRQNEVRGEFLYLSRRVFPPTCVCEKPLLYQGCSI